MEGIYARAARLATPNCCARERDCGEGWRNARAYEGISFEIRAGLGPNEWSLLIAYPDRASLLSCRLTARGMTPSRPRTVGSVLGSGGNARRRSSPLLNDLLGLDWVRIILCGLLDILGTIVAKLHSHASAQRVCRHRHKRRMETPSVGASPSTARSEDQQFARFLEPDSKLYVAHVGFGSVSRLSMTPIIASFAKPSAMKANAS
jgi:hypothetical protein